MNSHVDNGKDQESMQSSITLKLELAINLEVTIKAYKTSNQEGKYQETIQSFTTPDTRHQMGN